MSHVRIHLWADAPEGLVGPFGDETRDWVADVPPGHSLGEVNWGEMIEVDLAYGGTAIAGNDPKPRPGPDE